MPETDPAVPPADPQPQNQPDGLGDAGKKAIADERAARKAAEQQARALQDELTALTERSNILEAANTTLTSDAEARQLEVTRLNVGLAKGLSPQLIDRLRGTDEASLTADADALLALIPQQTPATPGARPDPSQGPRTPSTADPAAEFAALFTRARDN